MEVGIMAEDVFVNDAKVMSKGQVTIPKHVREALGVETGDRVTFIVEGSEIRVMNSAVYALKRFQKQMQGEAAGAGFSSEDDVADWITKSRREENAE
jgi:antitoxin PrlF